jgi:hypothetical protein
VREFDKEWARMEKRGNRIRVMAGAVMVFTWAMVLFGFLTIGWLINHPEKIGQFAGKIVSGYEEAQR